jgi:hypothetical protein
LSGYEEKEIKAAGGGVGLMAYIFGITGPYGSGKSTTGVIKAIQWASGSGAALFANFPLENAYLFDHYSDWYRIADLHGSIIVFDESQRQLDSRWWGGHGSVVFTQLMNYVRKMNCIFIFILPSYENIDTRVRQATDILITCYATAGGTILNTIYDYTHKEYGEFGRLLNRWSLPAASRKKVYDLDLFDTNSMVNNFPMPGSPKETEKFFRELEKRHNASLIRHNLKKNIKILIKEELPDLDPVEREDLIHVG